MNTIKVLPQNLIKKIAAGEVVERPASVVKELMENSIDAGAKNIRLEIEEGGIKSIAIHDDGIGMSEEDLLESYKLHSTSKISSIDDLNTIMTYGFRGEALASMCAVAKVTIHSKNENSTANQIVIENSDLISRSGKARSEGTSIVVEDIFRHLPARKKFLKTPATEYRYILAEFTRFAVIYNQVGFTLTHNGKSSFDLKATTEKKKRITDIFPTIKNEDLVEVNANYPDAKLSGFVAHPKILNNDRSKQFLYINSRSVNDRAIVKAAKEGYTASIAEYKEPIFFLNIDIDPNEVDVNIHPRKLEVRLSNASNVFRLVKNSISDKLASVYKSELHEKFTNNSNTISRENSFQKTQQLKYEPAKFENNFKFTYNNNRTSNDLGRPHHTNVSESLIFTSALLEKKQAINTYRCFQILQTYIVFEREEKIHIIDQHAADERVKYEAILQRIKTKKHIEQQDLLIAEVIELGEAKINMLAKHLENLKMFGVDADMISPTAIKINSVPVFSREFNFKNFLEEILSEIEEHDEVNLDKFFERIAASLACHSSIRAGRSLSMEEINKIVNDLFECEMPYSCPHGRPIIWTISQKEIEKHFERVK